MVLFFFLIFVLVIKGEIFESKLLFSLICFFKYSVIEVMFSV